MYRSEDRGRTWAQSDRGLPAASRIHAFGSLDQTVFAGTDAGIFRSEDHARSWQPATTPATASVRILCFATVGRRVFAGTDGSGILVSLDAGKSWELKAPFPAKKVRCLVALGERLYAGAEAEGVFVSSDGGSVWSPLQPGLPAQAQVFALAVAEGRLYAGLYTLGLHVWDEQARRWSRVGPVVPLALAAVEGSIVAGHNPGGLFWSGDRGVHWSKGTPGPGGPISTAFTGDSGELTEEAPVWELAGNDGLVIAGASSGIYTSSDRGRTWTRARVGLPAQSPGISFLVKPGLVLAGAQNVGGNPR